MNRKYRFLLLCGLLTICCPLLFFTGCSGPGPQDISANPKEPLKPRPSEPLVRTPEASQTSVLGQEPLIIDVSHTDQGYVMARYTGGAAKANIQITGPDSITYKYFLTPSEAFAVFPLTSGNGVYKLDAYENIVDNKYSSLFKETVEVTLENEFLPFLYPNQYVNFSPDTKAVSLAAQVVQKASSDLDAVSEIYHYVIENITYDDAKAEAVTSGSLSGYLPDVDSTLETKKGICFDYAALTAAMLRSQGIPTRLEIGYSGEVYHSWISVYIEDIGWIDKIIEFTGDSWTRMDPTFASSNKNSEKVLKYIGDGSNYSLQYTR